MTLKEQGCNLSRRNYLFFSPQGETGQWNQLPLYSIQQILLFTENDFSFNAPINPSIDRDVKRLVIISILFAGLRKLLHNLFHKKAIKQQNKITSRTLFHLHEKLTISKQRKRFWIASLIPYQIEGI